MHHFGLFFALMTPQPRSSMPTNTTSASHTLFPRF